MPDVTVIVTLADAMERYLAASAARWKPTTSQTCGSYARARIIPALGQLDIATVARADIEDFMGSLAKRPSMANRCGGLLSGFFRWCEERELRPEGSNPCAGTRRYRVRGRRRFLSDGEYRRLWRSLALIERHKPAQVACIRLIALTGCRQSEIRTLRWADYRDGALHLRDAKAGPRTAWLGAEAIAVLETQQRLRAAEPAHLRAEWVFPDRRDPRRARSKDLCAWRRIRAAAGIEDCRIHDLRHTYASHALMAGVPMPVVSRLLGHADIRMTMRYAHVGDRETQAAADRIGAALLQVLEGSA